MFSSLATLVHNVLTSPRAHRGSKGKPSQVERAKVKADATDLCRDFDDEWRWWLIDSTMANLADGLQTHAICFVVHLSMTRRVYPPCPRQSCVSGVGVLVVAPAPFVLFCCVSCWRNANLAGRFACCRFLACLFVLFLLFWYCLELWNQGVSHCLRFIYPLLSLLGPSLRAKSAATEEKKWIANSCALQKGIEVTCPKSFPSDTRDHKLLEQRSANPCSGAAVSVLSEQFKAFYKVQR